MCAQKQLPAPRRRVCEASDVLLNMRKEDLPALRAQAPDLVIEWSDVQHSWFYRPQCTSAVFPEALLRFLPEAPSDTHGRTFLEFPGDAEAAAALSLRWDSYVKCWWYPSPADILPAPVAKYRPSPFSWAAWCEQRINPSATLCQTPSNREVGSAAAQALANEMFRASMGPQPGFLYLRPATPERSFDVWLAIRRLTANHASVVAIVTTTADIPLWRALLRYLGTQPSSVILLTYRSIHLLDPRLPREGQTSGRILPRTCRAAIPDVIVWDHCHLLQTFERRVEPLARALSERTGWNLWISENPAATPDELGPLSNLLHSRECPRTPNPEKWLTWRAGAAHRPLSAAIQRALFERNSRGSLGGLRTAETTSSGPELIFRPVPGDGVATTAGEERWGRVPDSKLRRGLSETKIRSVVELARVHIGENRQVAIVCGSDQDIAAIEHLLGVNHTAFVLREGNLAPREFADWFSACRLALIHQIHLCPTGPLEQDTTLRTVISVDLPCNADEVACLLSISGRMSTVVLPYAAESFEEAIVRSLPLTGGCLLVGAHLPPLKAERY